MSARVSLCTSYRWAWLHAWVVGAVLSTSAVAYAQKDVITDIRVEGLRRVESEAALSGLRSRKGDPLDPEAISEDLRRVWGTGFFRDVRVEKVRHKGGWRIVFVVEEKPSIREVRYVGNDDVSEDDIKGVVDVQPFTILNIDKLKKNIEKIRNLYVEKGFYLAKVDYRIDKVPDSPFEVDVIFEMQENAKVVVKQIAFVGNKNLSDEELKSDLLTREGNELSWLTSSGTYKEEFFQADIFRIQNKYYDRGYVSVKVGQPTATISQDRRYIYLTIPLEEGLQYDIGAIKFSGQTSLKDPETGEELVNEEMLRERLRVSQGEVFNRTKLFEDIQTLTDVYRDQGYAYANVTPNSRIDPERRVVDLDLEVELGDIVYFERIEMVGNTRTRDKVIRRELRIVEGEKYSATGINQSRARVFQLGYFENVNITTSRGSKPNLMNVTVEIKEKSTGTFQIGAGFSSVESFIATAQIAQNNFLGNGQSLSLSAQLSFGTFARQLATLNFFEPYFLDTLWSLGFDAFITQRFYRDFQRNATGASTRFGYPITRELRLSAGYTLERIEIEESAGIIIDNLNRDGRNSEVGLFLAYDSRDNRLFPTNGQFHLLSTEFSDRSIGSQEGLEYRRFNMRFRFYRPLPWNFVFRLNASVGLILGRGDNAVPIAERFFPGGIFSVRGFAPRRLGPTQRVPISEDPGAQTFEFSKGGNKEAVFNLELEFPIIQKAGIKGVVFADAGNAFDDNEGFFYSGVKEENRPNAYLFRSGREIKPPLGLYYSFGFGFRWFSPIGPLRFEWGIPITKRAPEDRGLLFEFTIGNGF